MPLQPNPGGSQELELLSLLRDADAGIERIAALLDAQPPGQRLALLRGLGRDEQRALYAKAAAAPPLALEGLVPASVAPRTEVRHYGRNTLPLPLKHRLFEKRFCRPEGDASASLLFGYNEAPARRLIGPGYFVACSTEGKPQWRARGSVVVDYFSVPDAPVAPGWPRVVPNERGLQFFVYRHTRDFLRRVSTHACIGAAYKDEKPLDHYFVLCRDP